VLIIQKLVHQAGIAINIRYVLAAINLFDLLFALNKGSFRKGIQKGHERELFN
jgi:hypothetical protein